MTRQEIMKDLREIRYYYSRKKGFDELKNEINDLLYHVMVLCANQGLEWSEVEKVLEERNEKIGNLKKFHQVDKNT